jgi:ATP-dependent exoDNAse (exonuclease V) beta subunit
LLFQKLERWLQPPPVAELFQVAATQARLALPKARLVAWRERSFAVREARGLHSGQIDRLVAAYALDAEPGQPPLAAEVIDFKTDALSDSSPERRAAVVLELTERYREQLEAYRLAAARMLGLPAERVAARIALLDAGCVCMV